MSDLVTGGCFALVVGLLIVFYKIVVVVGLVLNSGAEERTKERQDYMTCFNQILDRFFVPKEHAIDLADMHRTERTNDRGIDAKLEEEKAKLRKGIHVVPKDREVDHRFSSVDSVAAENLATNK